MVIGHAKGNCEAPRSNNGLPRLSVAVQNTALINPFSTNVRFM